MGVFKNSVGRPTNKVIKTRRIAKLSIVFAVVAVVALTTGMLTTISTKKIKGDGYGDGVNYNQNIKVKTSSLSSGLKKAYKDDDFYYFAKKKNTNYKLTLNLKQTVGSSIYYNLYEEYTNKKVISCKKLSKKILKLDKFNVNLNEKYLEDASYVLNFYYDKQSCLNNKTSNIVKDSTRFIHVSHNDSMLMSHVDIYNANNDYYPVNSEHYIDKDYINYGYYDTDLKLNLENYGSYYLNINLHNSSNNTYYYRTFVKNNINKNDVLKTDCEKIKIKKDKNFQKYFNITNEDYDLNVKFKIYKNKKSCISDDTGELPLEDKNVIKFHNYNLVYSK